MGSDESDRRNERLSTVYVVATVHADHPHPKVEGVYRDRDDAVSGRKEALQGLGATAASIYEMEVR